MELETSDVFVGLVIVATVLLANGILSAYSDRLPSWVGKASTSIMVLSLPFLLFTPFFWVIGLPIVVYLVIRFITRRR
jgi:hypothetical protein